MAPSGTKSVGFTSSPSRSLSSQKYVAVLGLAKEIATLEPGKFRKGVIHVLFYHHLFPLKLILWCNGIKHLVKLRLDIGYFIMHLPMDLDVLLCCLFNIL
ncbi:AP3-complex subunit beta-A-like isoform X2 [Rutidosis leptorrhynchoides]|uniref:AP3-complex subunit beta-A-like isoform X2 n=1 Tax=Rutidosis leptorrhynchoides TaxID=125765 RepID=UPI003A9A4F60